MNHADGETSATRSGLAIVGGLLVLAGAAAFLAAGSPLDAAFRLLVAAPDTIAGYVSTLRGPIHLAAGAALFVAIGALLVSASPRGGTAARALAIIAGFLAGVDACCELHIITGMWASLGVVARSAVPPRPAELQAAAEAAAAELLVGHGALLACGGCLVIAGLLRVRAAGSGCLRVLPVVISAPAAFLLCGGWLLTCLHAAAVVRLFDDTTSISASEVVGHYQNMAGGGIIAGVGLGGLALALVLRGVMPSATVHDTGP